jgi:hypothetical protein
MDKAAPPTDKNGVAHCKAQTIRIDDTRPFDTSNQSFDHKNFLGNITLRLRGVFKLQSDGNWTFHGRLTALPDLYNFNRATHRSRLGETLTTIGRNLPGKPYWVNFIGSKPITWVGLRYGLK